MSVTTRRIQYQPAQGSAVHQSCAQSLCGAVDPNHASQTKAGAAVDGSGDTIVLSAADRFGNMVSWVNSNYGGFGSGITVSGYGFILHNRGALFTLDPKSPNVIAIAQAPIIARTNRPSLTDKELR